MQYLPATLESIAHQYDEAYEVLVCHVPSSPDVQRLTAPDLLPHARAVADKLNRLASIAQGDYLMVLADDDILLPNALHAWRGVAQANHLPDVVMAMRQNITERGEEIDITPTYPWESSTFARVNPVQGWTALVRRSVWQAVGGIAPDQLWQDYDFWYKCFLQGANACTIHRPLWGYRRHGDQIPDASPVWTEAWARLYATHPELRGT
jgi:glycosyltransferase involved in cell wall biosynthesis